MSCTGTSIYYIAAAEKKREEKCDNLLWFMILAYEDANA